MFAKMYLEITNACNLKCSFCPGTRREKQFMTEDAFRLLAGRLRPYGRFLYFHLMGEPLLHPNLAKFLEIAGELDFRVVLTTNGTLLRERQTVLLAAPALHKVNISLHAPEANGDALKLEPYLKAARHLRGRHPNRGLSAACGCGIWIGGPRLEKTSGMGRFSLCCIVRSQKHGFPIPTVCGWLNGCFWSGASGLTGPI